MNIAIIGATGLVGREILKILIEKGLTKNNKIELFASSKSAGKVIEENGEFYEVKELCKQNLKSHYNFALFSAGASVSRNWASEFIARGAYVIDNSSAFRREIDVPLVVPEVNLQTIQNNKLIANPNCSTIGAVLPIFALSKIGKIKRIIVSTYQAVSGAGQKGVIDLNCGSANKFAYAIKNNLIPQIDVGLENGYTFEEYKMEFELKKIEDNLNFRNVLLLTKDF